MTTKTRLFMSGCSQAVRLPAQLRIQAEEVRIEKVGNALWLIPEPVPGQNLGSWLQAFYDQNPALPDSFLGERTDALPPQEWAWS